MAVFEALQYVCVKVLYQVNTSLTTHKLLLADGEHASALQHLRVGAAGIDAGQEGLFCHPDWKPLQLAVAQQAGGVQTPARGEDFRNVTVRIYRGKIYQCKGEVLVSRWLYLGSKT